MKLFLLATLTMALFGANSLLCRAALYDQGMDPYSFTLLRTVSGAAVLWLYAIRRGLPPLGEGNYKAALALFGYMIFFSCAFVSMPAAPGTLILVAAIQVSMLALGCLRGERPGPRQVAGIGLAVCGIIILLLPGLTAPPFFPALLMLLSGLSWGVYSIYGRATPDPAGYTVGNFIRCLPLAALLIPFAHSLPLNGVLLSLASGAVCSAIGYIFWYYLLSRLDMPSAAVAQLGSPLFSAFGAVLLLGESFGTRLWLSASIVLLGIAYAGTRAQPRPGKHR